MRYHYTLLLTAALMGIGSIASAQGDNTSFTWKFEEGNKLMEEKFYNQAADIWRELLVNDPENANLNYKLGFSLFHSYNQKRKALPYLEKASMLRKAAGGAAFNVSGYDPFDHKVRNAPSEVDYYLARAYHLDGDFDKADSFYQKFFDAEPKHLLRPLAKRGLEQTANARDLMSTPKDYAVYNIGAMINTEGPDFSPVLAVDGNALFFTSRRVRPDSANIGIIDPVAGMPYENIYVSYKDREGNWQTPELLNINPGMGHLASINASVDAQTLFIYRADDGDGNIYESRLVGELWSDPVLVGSDVNTRAWETHASLSPDGQTLYFVSDRAGGIGGRDLYRVVRLPNGEWSKAQNLGPTVNTEHDEDGVFIHPNGRTMYFASTGHNSMGGFDIFRTELQDDGTWTVPENMGYPLNTVDDDVFFITTADGKRGYFSSDQIGGYGEKDIYFVDMPGEEEAEGLTVLKGFIIPATGESLPASTMLIVTDKTTGEQKTYRPRMRDGVYVAILPPCREYNLDYRVNDVTVHTEDIFVECETSYQEINKEIYLNPVSLGGPASIVDLPKGKPPGAKEVGERVDPITGKTIKEDAAAAEARKAQTAAVAAEEARRAEAAKATKEGKPTTASPSPGYVDEFARFYAYNARDIDQADKDWKRFVDNVVALIEKNGEARIVIEASASKVPTRTYGNNETLSRLRMEDARKRLVEAVEARGKDASLLKLEAINSLVQGPAYQGDYRNTEKYGRFQFVKLKTR